MPPVNRLCLLLAFLPLQAFAGTHDACEWPEIEIKGLEFDLRDTNKTLERLRMRKENYDAMEDQKAKAKETQREIERFEKMEKELQDDLNKKRPAYEATCN